MRKPRILLALLALCMAFLLCGCASRDLMASPQDLYTLPALPERYTKINEQLKTILDEGAEYAAPTSGNNIQPVQMVDLNADGRLEAVAFFRRNGDEKPLKIYIFTARDDGYEQTGLIEGSGTAFSGIEYSDLDGDRNMELIIGWRTSAELQALSLVSLKGGVTELMSSEYVQYALVDFDGDAKQEIVIFRADGDGRGMAECYGWQSGGMGQESAVRLSVTMADLSQQGQVRAGTLADGTAALFVTSVLSSSQAVVDILVRQDGVLVNPVVSPITGVSSEVGAYAGVYPTDLDGDGVTEVPHVLPMPTREDGILSEQRIAWQQYRADGTAETALHTYHETEQAWYFKLPEAWNDAVLVEHADTEEEKSVTFYARVNDEVFSRPVLSITAISGPARERRAVSGNRFILTRKGDTIYAAELLEGNAAWQHGLTEDEVRSAFFVIADDWSV